MNLNLRLILHIFKTRISPHTMYLVDDKDDEEKKKDEDEEG